MDRVRILDPQSTRRVGAPKARSAGQLPPSRPRLVPRRRVPCAPRSGPRRRRSSARPSPRSPR